MILVDTSVIVDSFKGIKNEKVELFSKILADKVAYGISAYTYQEILQGARDEHEFNILKKYLSVSRVYFLPETIETYEKAAKMFFDLRRQGITPRSILDVRIALTAIENNLLLLHNDKDFDMMSNKMSELKILNEL